MPPSFYELKLQKIFISMQNEYLTKMYMQSIKSLQKRILIKTAHLYHSLIYCSRIKFQCSKVSAADYHILFLLSPKKPIKIKRGQELEFGQSEKNSSLMLLTHNTHSHNCRQMVRKDHYWQRYILPVRQLAEQKYVG